MHQSSSQRFSIGFQHLGLIFGRRTAESIANKRLNVFLYNVIFGFMIFEISFRVLDFLDFFPLQFSDFFSDFFQKIFFGFEKKYIFFGVEKKNWI